MGPESVSHLAEGSASVQSVASLAYVFRSPALVPEAGTQPSRQDASGLCPWDAEARRCSSSILQAYHIKPCHAMPRHVG